MSERTPNQAKIRGIVPAVLVSRTGSGAVDWRAFERNLEFLLGFDIAGVCVNGATGEYVMATAEERAEAVRLARRAAGKRLVVSGVGAPSFQEAADYSAHAEQAGADALLVPSPHFFRYAEDDLSEFYVRLAGRLSVPALIYNLAAFAGPIPKDLSVRLIADVPGIAGIKDSSGSLATLEALQGTPEVVRFVGNDSVLSEAIQRGLCNGAISGIAGVIPELTLGLWRAGESGDKALFEELTKQQAVLIGMIDRWPVPWALKWIAQFRGLFEADFALPLSASRKSQAKELQGHFESWWSAMAPLFEGQLAISGNASRSS